MTEPALVAKDAPTRVKPSNYPEPFASRMPGRIKRPPGDLFGLTGFGVNLTRLAPSSVSAFHHQHSRQDGFIYVVDGEPTLFAGNEAMQLRPGMVAGFAAGGVAHHLENQTDRDCTVLEVGDRAHGDEVRYPSDDIKALMDGNGK